MTIRQLAAESGLIHGAEAAKAATPLQAINTGALAGSALDAYLEQASEKEAADAIAGTLTWYEGFLSGFYHGYTALAEDPI